MPDVRTDDWLLGEGVCCIYQEIQSGCCNAARDRLQHKRNKNQDFTTQLAAELGLFSVFGKAMDTGGGEYGVAILSNILLFISITKLLKV